jgi:hypothetical protein
MKPGSARVWSTAVMLLLLAGSTSGAMANVAVAEAMHGSFIVAARGADEAAILKNGAGGRVLRGFGNGTGTDGFGSNTSALERGAVRSPKPQGWALLVTGMGLIGFALKQRQPVKVLGSAN